LIVANLAEAACEAIGANVLLARVGCTFHDIGKMLHPEYFVENQPPQESRHERLAPSMSSLVILNHVKDGVELARRYRLNPAIIDFIPGHHGTGLIYYFYRRALEEVEEEGQLKEEGFRYPGPRPHSRETAVALLADSSEAAVRTLKEKSPARIQEVVRRIINNKFIDGQLDECDLTLKDLNRIGEAFLRVLAGIYHRRIEYPKTPWEEEEEREGRRRASGAA
jgi:putative nucleotidyltransferase with HDIG domain